jgi:multidrug efflux pump subunit AcrA (membrane-fusion protein)
MKHTRWFFIPFIALLSLVLAACAKHDGGNAGEEESRVMPLVAVRSTEIVVGDAMQTISGTGRTDVLRREKVLAPVAGTIASLNVLDGSHVHKGQILATILTKESHAAIMGADELLHSARTEKQREEAERALQLARSTQNTVTITARSNGVVAGRTVNGGENVQENTELMTIVDLSSIVFIAEIPLRDIRRIRIGMPGRIRLASNPDDLFAGRVDAILPQSEPQSQTASVRLRFQRVGMRKELLPDMGGGVEVVVGIRKNALLVPKVALLRNDETNSSSVVVIAPDSLSLSIPVTVGAWGDSTVEVISPQLRAGMSVIIEGQYMLADSTRVTVSAKDDR